MSVLARYEALAGEWTMAIIAVICAVLGTLVVETLPASAATPTNRDQEVLEIVFYYL
jgi:hypothetical protein